MLFSKYDQGENYWSDLKVMEEPDMWIMQEKKISGRSNSKCKGPRRV